MTEIGIYRALLTVFACLGGLSFIALLFVPAPYGRHSRRGWGPMVPVRLGWLLMESPAAVVFAVCFFLSPRGVSLAAVVFLAMWEVHYLHRALVFPFRLSPGSKPMALLVVLLGFAFNIINGYLNGRYLFAFGPDLRPSWLLDPRFAAGTAVFAAGFAINRWADETLRRLRQPGESGYKIPRGGLYRWISCPNYLGEILQWCGWALAAWSPPGLIFALWTFANLAPRARAHHKWYRAVFSDYPPERRALLPLLF